jgi:hypothetical protein
MNKAKKEELEKNGWKVGSVSEFLNLSKKEEAAIESKLALKQKSKSN